MFRQAATFTATLLIAGTVSLAAAEQIAMPETPILPGDTGPIARAASGQEPAAMLASPSPKRPALLPALYATFATLQVLDMVSTKKALAAGGHEANPLLRHGNMGTTIAVKAASATATVYLTEKLWKRNRVAAIVVMVAINIAGTVVVSHNNRVARR